MFGKNETLHREYYWTDTATKISAIRIDLIDQKTTILKVGETSENKNLPHPEASRVIISRNAQNNDLILDYFQDDNRTLSTWNAKRQKLSMLQRVLRQVDELWSCDRPQKTSRIMRRY